MKGNRVPTVLVSRRKLSFHFLVPSANYKAERDLECEYSRTRHVRKRTLQFVFLPTARNFQIIAIMTDLGGEDP